MRTEQGLQDNEPRFAIGVFNYRSPAFAGIRSKPFRKPFSNAAEMRRWMESAAFSHYSVSSVERIRMQHAEREPFPWPSKQLWLQLLGQAVAVLLFGGFVYLDEYYPAILALMFAIFWLIAGGLKIAEWRGTWPFRPLPPLFKLPPAPPPKDEPFRPTPLRPRRDQAQT